MSLAVTLLPLVLLLSGPSAIEDGIDLADMRLVPCAARFQAGDPRTGLARGAGFYAPEQTRAGRRFAWAQSRAEIWLVLGERAEPRQLVLISAGIVDGLGVRVLLNGVELGETSLRKGFEESTWSVPPAAVRPGPNVVVLLADTDRQVGRKGRRLALAMGDLRVEPDASECAVGSGGGEVSLPVTLTAGAALVAPLMVPPEGRLRIGVTGEPGASLDVVVSAEQRHLQTGPVVLPPSGSGWQEITLTACCGVDRGLMLVARGPHPVRLDALEVLGKDTVGAWLAACGNVAPQVVAAVGLGIVFLLAAWRGWRLPLDRWAPWGDVLLVVAVAMLMRYLYLAEYPHTNPGLLPDAGEYLLRARSLATGQSSFLGDFYWHRWQTWLRPPGYYFFLAQLFKLGVEAAADIARIQTVFWVATTAATYSVSYLLFGRAAALVAGLLWAFNFEALTYSSVVGTEALFMLFLLPALALLALMSKRQSSFRLGLAAGVLFGLAALVRSAPVLFVPAAAALIVLGRGFRRSVRPAAALVLGMAVVVLPWCVRNSVLLGRPMGVDNMGVPNFLFSHPDERYLDSRSYDPATGEGKEEYYFRVKRSGDGLASQPILRDGLVRLIAQPGDTLRSIGMGLKRFFHPHTEVIGRLAGESEPCRMAAIAALANWQTFPLLVLALIAIVARLKDRSTWPVLFWFLLILALSVVLFPLRMADLPRYRLTTLPVLFGYAGWALCWLYEALGRVLSKASHRPSG